MTPWNDQTVTERHREVIKIQIGVFIFFVDSADRKYAKRASFWRGFHAEILRNEARKSIGSRLSCFETSPRSMYNMGVVRNWKTRYK